MFLPFFDALRTAGVPVSLREFLSFLDVMDHGLGGYDIDQVYLLARTTLVKSETYIDRFDRAFAEAFKGLESVTDDALLDAMDIPEDWLRKLAERHMTPDEMADIEALGGFDKLMETLKERLADQKGRHQGGNKWIGTAGTSPFGAYGYNPEGVRIGQESSRHRRATKVWDKREFRDFDDTRELGTRAMKVALKRLRRWARDGADEELDLDGTINATARNGYLDVKTRPERRNAVKLLLFLDVGGSMDDHIGLVDDLFSAARSEFKHLEHFYFHNCLYEGVWRDNMRRWREQVSTMDLLNTYGPDYKCIFVGDASMSPYEIVMAGGANEHWNREPGEVWLRRAISQWADTLWINPVAEQYWGYTQSIAMIEQIIGPERMVPLTLEGLTRGMKVLT